jgi:hypothetical protein
LEEEKVVVLVWTQPPLLLLLLHIVIRLAWLSAVVDAAGGDGKCGE